MSTPAHLTWTRRLEEAEVLDPVVQAARSKVAPLMADPRVRDLLHGKWLGHALHPLLSDVPIGMWTSALVLDLVGDRQDRDAAQRLVGLGVLAAAPTALTGWSEWADSGQREQRVGVVHAASNATAVLLFAQSWLARRRGNHRRGRRIALVASAGLGLGGYLGGHLVSARKVSSRHPVFDDTLLASPSETTDN
jgi:uncharacterized membrane protein